jgi:hypothetical protein
MPRITRQSPQLENANPVMRTLFTVVSAHVPLAQEILLASAPAPDSFTCLRILRLDHEQDPPGTATVSPSAAELMAAATADWEQSAALIVAAPAVRI